MLFHNTFVSEIGNIFVSTFGNNFVSNFAAIMSIDWLSNKAAQWIGRWFPEDKSVGVDRGLAAYHITNLGCMLYFSIVGTATWFLHPVKSYAAVYERMPWIQNLLLWPMFQYQVWNFFVSFRHRSLRNFPTLFHHVASFLLTGVSALVPVFQYPALFLCGPYEISSVFLVVYNMFCLDPAWKTRFARIHNANKIAFFVSFLGIRIAGFAYYLGRQFVSLLYDQPTMVGLFAPFFLLQVAWVGHIAFLTIRQLLGNS
jgi:hypothetical protein